MSDAPRTYPHGVPCWIDTQQPDPEAACRFYGDLFGWTFADAVPAGAPGHYFIAQLDGRDAGAVAPADDGATEAIWNTYVAVDDADAALAKAVAGGATATQEALDAGPGGRSAAFDDPTGASLGLWQPKRRLGVQITNEPGSWNFSDLHTTDPAAAERFYAELFGWEADPDEYGAGAQMWRRPGYGDHLAATIDPGIHERQAAIEAPPGFADAIAWLAGVDDGEAPNWHVTFTVEDRDDSVARALDLGATDRSGPVDTPWTKSAVIRDPQGALLTLSQFDPQGFDG